VLLHYSRKGKGWLSCMLWECMGEV